MKGEGSTHTRARARARACAFASRGCGVAECPASSLSGGHTGEARTLGARAPLLLLAWTWRLLPLFIITRSHYNKKLPGQREGCQLPKGTSKARQKALAGAGVRVRVLEREMEMAEADSKGRPTAATVYGVTFLSSRWVEFTGHEDEALEPASSCSSLDLSKCPLPPLARSRDHATG